MTGNWQCKSSAIMRRETNIHTYLLVARNRREGTLVLNPKARFLFENAKKRRTSWQVQLRVDDKRSVRRKERFRKRMQEIIEYWSEVSDERRKRRVCCKGTIARIAFSYTLFASSSTSHTWRL